MNEIGNLWNAQLFDKYGNCINLAKQKRFSEHLVKKMKGLSFVKAGADVPLRPVFLTHEMYCSLMRLSRNLLRLIIRICGEKSGDDPHKLAELLCYPNKYLRLLSKSPLRNKWAAEMARPDVIINNGIPVFLECNVHSGLGGVVNSDILNLLFLNSSVSVQLRRAGAIWSYSTLAARQRFLEDIGRELNPAQPPSVAVIGWTQGEEDGSARFFQEHARYLTAHGIPAVFIELNNIDFYNGKIFHGNQSFDIALRIFITREIVKSGTNPDALSKLQRSEGTLLVADDICSLYTSKLVFAWLSEASADLTNAADRSFIDKHIPWTRQVSKSFTGYHGKRIDLPSFVGKHRKKFVLKPLAQSGGANVYIGKETSEAVWLNLIQEAVNKKNMIVQAYVQSDPVSMPFYIPEQQSVEIRDVPVILGPFIMGRHDGGCSARHPSDLSPKGAINFSSGTAIANTTAIGQLAHK